MLHIFTKTNATRVRTDRDAEFGSHEENSQDFVYPADAASVDLADADGVGLKELFEDDSILHVLAGGNADRRHCARDRSMSKNIVRAGGLFDPEGVEGRQALHSADSLVHLPHLVCIEHQGTLWPDLFAHDARTAHIILQAQADLQFEVPPVAGQRFTAKPAHLLIAIARPASPGCIGGEAILYHLHLALRFGRSLA